MESGGDFFFVVGYLSLDVIFFHKKRGDLDIWFTILSNGTNKWGSPRPLNGDFHFSFSLFAALFPSLIK